MMVVEIVSESLSESVQFMNHGYFTERAPDGDAAGGPQISATVDGSLPPSSTAGGACS